jgi:hypothetical protein
MASKLYVRTGCKHTTYVCIFDGFITESDVEFKHQGTA